MLQFWHFVLVLMTVLEVAPATQPVGELISDNDSTVVSTTAPVGTTRELITIQNGELPILLSAPHGGLLPIPHATTRTGAKVNKKRGGKNIFVVSTDKGVDVVTLRVADEIERLTGKRPYVVVANFSRRYVDANRVPEEAYESDAAEQVYERYHDAIRKFRREIIDTWGRGMLLDIHGHSGDREALIRGTANWNSVRHLVGEFGKKALTGEDGLLGPLESAGVKIVPLNANETDREVPSLNGGFITRSYGSFQGGIFDSIQLELGGKLRSGEGARTFGTQLAEAIVPFMNRYLLIPPPVDSPTTSPTTQSTTQAVDVPPAPLEN